ncbi:2-amino-4-hydroxy-6-hydroxymethyldihydropteridine diphosphokinase [Acidihalobacter ferrooxydans]|uniref:2-amino-4-hydroxy-6-hydroxymethyldihydropteridine pyrophosphokinase n=1 Tax=Acidihalobacter ferrooxydans TaxID=1765967 RepID=A0A1P8UEH9_9GAMM|nr:2-amino-4-hydroxy-6-hydroxymethyldihydropteridine diphosphokinase [Acidihalobacter ferrooxydans]APZ42164.1 2-amino-4-hydroxy-6-hydroxymethyldihydropteridine diphosphokinase [Acidihalobacter ferrooxydans]
MPERVLAYVGLGSNLQTPEQQLRQALDELARIPRTRLVAQSGLYRNPPMGPVAQPDFVNAAAALETQLPALELLDELQAIEQAHGRVRIERWGPRTLDLDLLLYGDHSIEEPRLRVPHPGLHERPFVLYPLAEIAPELTLPGHGTLSGCLARCSPGSLERIESHG